MWSEVNGMYFREDPDVLEQCIGLFGAIYDEVLFFMAWLGQYPANWVIRRLPRKDVKDVKAGIIPGMTQSYLRQKWGMTLRKSCFGTLSDCYPRRKEWINQVPSLGWPVGLDPVLGITGHSVNGRKVSMSFTPVIQKMALCRYNPEEYGWRQMLSMETQDKNAEL